MQELDEGYNRAVQKLHAIVARGRLLLDRSDASVTPQKPALPGLR